MASHLSSIGVSVTSALALETLAAQAIKDRSCAVYGTGAGRYFRWRSASGAEIWLQADRRRRLIGANPHFSGEGRIRVGLCTRIQRPEESELDGAYGGWVAPDDPARLETGLAVQEELFSSPSGRQHRSGFPPAASFPRGSFGSAPMEADSDQQPPEGLPGLCPLVFDVPDAGRHLGLSLPRIEPVQMAAFAHSLTLWPAEKASGETRGVQGQMPGAAALAEPEAREPFKWAVVGRFLDAGGEVPPDVGAEALLTGALLKAERLTNELTEEAFWWLLVESQGGTYDLVADPELVAEQPAPGSVVQATVWLSGRLIAHDKPQRSLGDRLLGGLVRRRRPAGGE